MGEVGIVTWLAAGYGVFLLLVAFGLDAMARRTATRAGAWSSGAFTYHADHDAWICPEDQWLWPQSFDPDNRVMRYRASPAVCNACPVKETCTTSMHGREVTRNVDPWPSSEAERFHRGIACAVAVLGAAWPAGMLLTVQAPGEALVLSAAVALVLGGSWPLWSHLRRSPAAFPDHVRVEPPDEAAVARAVAAAREARRRSGYRSDRRADGQVGASAGSGPVSVQIGRRPGRGDRLAPGTANGFGRGAAGDAAGGRTPGAADGHGTADAEPARPDRFATRWGAFEQAAEGEELPGGWSRRKA
ncbi:hypothetical protein MF406_00845 [Georgenia sp. TF02-10]|uniref:hypothetical protein n=1 Tax=Georgenia sp. TF02-10 TaxID=2917725 RepID=UPI001FA7BC6E|nr:hypothetical protein [Georgenia sp. TF02-10]UNX54880.1 hypothetical protein MF406_00845 [Georgenia sp. TF02-10]